MEEARSLIIQRKPRIILDKSFSVKQDLHTGESGQMEIVGFIDSERIEVQPDGTDLLVKTIRIETSELIRKKNTRS